MKNEENSKDNKEANKRSKLILLGIGDWPNPQSPIPNPQSPIPKNI